MGIEPFLLVALGEDGQLSRWQVSTELARAVEPCG
jgi:hypothetical protein